MSLIYGPSPFYGHCKLIVCTALIWLDISDARNFFLGTVFQMEKFRIYSYRWQVQNARRYIEDNPGMFLLLQDLLCIISKYPELDYQSKIIFDDMIEVELPSFEWLDYAKRLSVIDDIKDIAVNNYA